MEEKKKGGVRPNSGRKKVNDKKVQFVVYVPKSWIPEKSGDMMRLRERVVDFIESDTNPILSQNKPVEGNVRQADDVSNLGRKKKPDVKIQDLTNQSKTNYSVDTTRGFESVAQPYEENDDEKAEMRRLKIEQLQKAANSCADTKLGRLAKAGYLKQITELQSLLK